MTSGLEVVMSDLNQVSSVLNTEIETVSSTTAESFSREIESQLRDRMIGGANPASNTSDFQWRKTVEKTTEELVRIQQ
jgi:hypothetical protein